MGWRVWTKEGVPRSLLFYVLLLSGGSQLWSLVGLTVAFCPYTRDRSPVRDRDRGGGGGEAARWASRKVLILRGRAVHQLSIEAHG